LCYYFPRCSRRTHMHRSTEAREKHSQAVLCHPDTFFFLSEPSVFRFYPPHVRMSGVCDGRSGAERGEEGMRQNNWAGGVGRPLSGVGYVEREALSGCSATQHHHPPRPSLFFLVCLFAASQILGATRVAKRKKEKEVRKGGKMQTGPPTQIGPFGLGLGLGWDGMGGLRLFLSQRKFHGIA